MFLTYLKLEQTFLTLKISFRVYGFFIGQKCGIHNLGFRTKIRYFIPQMSPLFASGRTQIDKKINVFDLFEARTNFSNNKISFRVYG